MAGAGTAVKKRRVYKPITARTPEIRERFLSALVEAAGNITRACELSNTCRRSMYDWRETDERFAAEWDRALEVAVDRLEDEARRRAYEGVEEPVWYQGEQCGLVRKYSDNLLVFLLRGRRKAVFGDGQKHINVNVSGEVEHRHVHLTPEIAARLRAIGGAAAAELLPPEEPDDGADGSA